MPSNPLRSPASLLAPLLTAVVETAVAAPLLALLDAVADHNGLSDAPSAFVLGIIGLLGYLLTRWLQRREIGLRALQGVLLGGAVVLAVVAPMVQGLGSLWNPGAPGVVILASAVAVVAWWRGMQYGSDPEPFGAERLNTLVKVAWVALVAQVLLVTTLDGDRGDAVADALRIAMPVAAVAGLMLLAIGQIEQARINAARRGGRAPERKGWMLYAALFAVALLVLATLGSALFGGDATSWILAPLGWVVRSVVFVLTWILIGVAFVFFILFYPIFWLLSRLRADPQPQEEQQQGELGPMQQIIDEGADGLPEALQTAIEIGAVVLIIAAVLVALALTMRRVRAQSDVDVADEERESLWSRELAMSQLKGIFRREHGDELDRIDLRQPPRSVREAYRALQALARRDGVPRREAETPAEFSRRLARAWPSEAAAITDLTRRYERVRYGAAPDEPELTAARQSWDVILSGRNRARPGTEVPD
ncbi:MAG: DUF4129 domain-containing protein [Thermomicrobiales bacterium]|nr:DUF4129 domain-containing protein [Thermomicrobiales bacterium]